MGSKILGAGADLGDIVVTNDDVIGLTQTGGSETQEKTAKLLKTTTGFNARARISKSQTQFTMALTATLRALEHAGYLNLNKGEDQRPILEFNDDGYLNLEGQMLDPSFKYEIGGIYFASTGTSNTPSIASKLHHALGLRSKDFIADDLDAACTGGVRALFNANMLVNHPSRKYHKVLAVAAEDYSSQISGSDYGTQAVFGDGAGAILIGYNEILEGVFGGISYTDGSKGRFIEHRGIDLEKYLAMEGHEVYVWAKKIIESLLYEFLDEYGDNIDIYLAHQANMRMINKAKTAITNRNLHDRPFEGEVIAGADDFGNIGAASGFILFDYLARKGEFKKGKKIAMSGFGGGLTAMIIGLDTNLYKSRLDEKSSAAYQASHRYTEQVGRIRTILHR